MNKRVINNYINEIKYFNVQDLKLSEVHKWPALFRWASPFLLAFVLISSFNMFYADSVESKISSLESDARSDLSNIERSSQQMVNKKELQNQIDSINEHYKETRSTFPSKIDINKVIKKLVSNHQVSNFSVNKVNISDKNRKDFHNEQQINISSTGSYHGFGQFVTHLANVRDMFTIENFLIEPMDESDNLSFYLEIKVYERNDADVSSAEYTPDEVVSEDETDNDNDSELINLM